MKVLAAGGRKVDGQLSREAVVAEAHRSAPYS
jgi:hypothetical protein